MLSTRVVVCLVILGFASAVTVLYLDLMLDRSITSNNVEFSLQVAIGVSLMALKFTQNFRVIALDSDARLFCVFVMLNWSVIAVFIVAFRLDYSGLVFAIFNSIFLPLTVLALYLVSKQPLVIGIFSSDLESELKGFGVLVNLSGPQDRALSRCDLVVGRMASSVGPVDVGNSAALSLESRAMERLVMRGGIPVVSHIDFVEAKTGKLSPANVVSLASMSLRLRLTYGPVKRLVDLLLCLPVGLALLLVAPFIIAAIKVESRGPAFFVQRRFGFQGRSFKLVKFRTMTHDPQHVKNLGSDDGHRITKVGALLRKTRVDELPQIINVIKGEMSWIGPRPETTKLARQYLRSVPYFRLRHLVRPGVTGWAQVHQGYTFGAEAFSEKVLHDLYYIKHYSPALDLIITVKTVVTMFGGRGAR